MMENILIGLSTMVAMGAAGFFGIELTPIAMSAPIVILTLAVADSVHILLSLRGLMRERFARVTVRKPEASRDRSSEIYLVAKGFGV